VKILLANLPWRRGNLWGVRAGSRWPHIKTVQEKGYLPFPFFLAYAAALLKREGYEVKVIDALAEKLSVNTFLRAVQQAKPDLLVAETSTPSLVNDLGILKSLPPDLPMALCGPEANIRSPEFLTLNGFIDYIFVGEYEFTLLELAQRLESKKNLGGLGGLIYKESGSVKVNPLRPLLEDLDSLPWPLRDGLPMERYNDTPGGIPTPSVQMWTSRGCPYQCLFCMWPQLMYQSNRYRIRSVVSVVDEMEYFVRVKEFKSVYFDDDTMNIGKLRMLQFAEEIRRRNLNVPWAMMARADLMDEDILESLRSSGLQAVKYGVESADQKLLENIRKGMDLRKVERMVRFTKAIGIKTHLTFAFGLPGETRDTIQKTIDFALALDPDSAQFSIATAFPGTSYFQDLERKGHLVSLDFSSYDGNFNSMLRTDSLGPQDLEQAKRHAEREWQGHIWKTRRDRSGGYARKIWRSFKDYGLGFTFSKALDLIRVKLAILRSFSNIRALNPALWLRGPSRRILHPDLKMVLSKTRKHYLNILGVYHGSYAFKGPDCVQIDLTSNCNNNCVSCWCNSPLLGDMAYKGSKKLKTLPTDLVIGLIDELAGLGTSELYFSGGGEPFMHPDILPIVAHAKLRGMSCCINTNFTLVNELTVKRLIELAVDSLTVSVWAGTPQTYALTHPNKDEATFHRIKCTLKMLNSLKNSARPRIKIYNVISNLNYAELEAMIDLAEETGSEFVEFTVVDTIPGATDKLMLSQAERQEVLAQCVRIQKRGSKVQVLNLDNFMRRLSDTGADLAQYDSGLLNGLPCYVGWMFSRIMSDGDVNFCLKAHRAPVGNLYQNSFREIWNSKEQVNFRQKALRHDLTDPFFRRIGNDESCQAGCNKSCDNLGHNDQVVTAIRATNSVVRKIIQAHACAMKICGKGG
jgi:radical SAM superfamily enzyme YgiQ (UPF0313 family)/MoaA/NifB/PqqE/SkfB family radical SAM enzyme